MGLDIWPGRNTPVSVNPRKGKSEVCIGNFYPPFSIPTNVCPGQRGRKSEFVAVSGVRSKMCFDHTSYNCFMLLWLALQLSLIMVTQMNLAQSLANPFPLNPFQELLLQSPCSGSRSTPCTPVALGITWKLLFQCLYPGSNPNQELSISREIHSLHDSNSWQG